MNATGDTNVIRATRLRDEDGDYVYWNTDKGWGSLEDATRYSDEEKDRNPSAVVGGEWDVDEGAQAANDVGFRPIPGREKHHGLPVGTRDGEDGEWAWAKDGDTAHEAARAAVRARIEKEVRPLIGDEAWARLLEPMVDEDDAIDKCIDFWSTEYYLSVDDVQVDDGADGYFYRVR